MSALHLLFVPCQVCDHPEAHKVAVFSDPDGFESNSYRFVTPEYCPKCRTIYSVYDMMALQSEIRERVEDVESEYHAHRRMTA